ncbi:MAG: serine--tRNA ligase [Candidatus Dadabacteria bacterium]|nr:serine--tRNA ligase [Candidatus Dadabacteria bacterium]
MLDMKLLREDIDRVKKGVSARGVEIDFDNFVFLDKKRRLLIKEVEQLENKRNTGSKELGKLKQEGKEDQPVKIQLELKTISEEIKKLNENRTRVETELRDFALTIPNIPHRSVPYGNGEDNNVEIKRSGEIADLDFEPLDHVELGKSLGILDLDRAAKITGARFSLYTGAGARLERSLINLMLDLHTEHHGYTETLPPFMANRESFIATGNLPKFEDDLFKIEGLEYYLVPTAEVPVTNIHRDEILAEQELPVKYAAYTPCFRKEAGSYGKDARGIIRQHQFNKVELVKLSHPEESYEELESLLEDSASVLELLELPYRIVTLCTADLGFSSAKTYDIEVWVTSERKYREISSCSNYEDFQSRRANIRFRPKGGGKPRFVHTLNGSGLAVGRTVVGILENYQQSDGSVIIPKALIPYMGGIERIEKSESR